MRDLIRSIKKNERIDHIFAYVLNNLYRSGPVSVTDMEILSYLALYCPLQFEIRKDTVLNYMGVFYKDITRNTLTEVIFGQYRKYIKETYKHDYTPIQADIVKGISNSSCFSFSAPTSTGKSFVFLNRIKNCQNDVVVVVPSRALINEYYLKLCDLISDKSVNILTFIDKINTQFAKKNIFIVTPERCRELFKQKDSFKIDIFLFDEAQLSDEDSKRGLYFDSIVRRCNKSFPASKFVFAHPFVKNPGSQIEKNHFDPKTANSIQYQQKNVGQLFLCKDADNRFYHFGIDTLIMGKRKLLADFDPIENTIKNGGSALFYVSKNKIYKGHILTQFTKYIDLCEEIKNERIEIYIEQLKHYTGGETMINRNHYSLLLALLKRGIVIHHGSLPLQTRVLIEQFTKEGLCKICFATSTLEQGINMPFDVVFLDRLESSKPLSVKNLIGRAGRSSTMSKFDYGFVVINSKNKVSKFRKIIMQDEILDDVSALEKNDQHDDDYNNFKDAILNDTFSDEYNLPENELEKLSSDSIDGIVEQILNAAYFEADLIPLSQIIDDLDFKASLYSYFRNLYSLYLGRPLQVSESNVLTTAVKIIFWRVYGKTFKNICWYRYSYVSRSHEREKLKSSNTMLNNLEAAFVTGYNDLPNKNLKVFSLFPKGTKAEDVSYDLIMYDTYDFIDKLIGFKLSDIFYAAFMKYFEKYKDSRSVKMAKYIKYGTDSERLIWMLRYGLTFEDIEILDNHIEDINETRIIFKPSFTDLTDKEKLPVLRFIN